jgi:hypothetical protein
MTDAEAVVTAAWLAWAKAAKGTSVSAAARLIEAIVLTIVMNPGQ